MHASKVYGEHSQGAQVIINKAAELNRETTEPYEEPDFEYKHH